MVTSESNPGTFARQNISSEFRPSQLRVTPKQNFISNKIKIKLGTYEFVHALVKKKGGDKTILLFYFKLFLMFKKHFLNP